MASEAERERLARAGFEAFGTGDGTAILEYFAEDIEIFSSPELANPGTFHGHDGYLGWIGPWTEVWEGLEFEITGMTPVGDRHVVVEAHQAARGRAGIEVSMDVAFVFEIEDGLVAYLALMPSPEQAIGLSREREGI